MNVTIFFLFPVVSVSNKHMNPPLRLCSILHHFSFGFLCCAAFCVVLTGVRGAPDHLCSTAADPGTDRCDVPVPQVMEETVRFHKSAYNDALSKRLWVCSCCWRFWQPVGLCLAGGRLAAPPGGHSVLRGLRWDIVAAGPTDVHNLFPDTMYLCHCSREMLKTW